MSRTRRTARPGCAAIAGVALEQQPGVTGGLHADLLRCRRPPASRSERPVWRRKTSSRVASERLIDLTADLLGVEQPEDLGKGGAPVLDVQAHLVVRRNLPHGRTVGRPTASRPVWRPPSTSRRLSTTDSPATCRFSSRGVPPDHDFAVVHDHQAVAQGVGLLEVVSGEEDGGTSVAQGADVVPQVGAVLRVEPGARLVQEKHLGLVDDPQGNVQPPALAPRVGLYPPVSELGEGQGFP